MYLDNVDIKKSERRGVAGHGSVRGQWKVIRDNLLHKE